MDAIFEWIGKHLLTAIIIAAVTPFALRIVNTLIRRSVRRAIKSDRYSSAKAERQREDTLISIMTAVAAVVVWGMSGMLILTSIGVEIGPLIAATSVIGVGIGFGAQDAIKDFIAGVFIILENQYRVGDVVEIAGESGVVEGITIRETILRNLDGHVVHVPNGVVEVSKNMTMDWSRLNINVGVSYDSDIDKVEKVVNEVGQAMAEDEEWKEKIIKAPEFIRIDSFGASEVDIKILGDVQPGKQWDVMGEYRKRLKAAFDKNKIEIPFPQRVIHEVKD